MDIKIEINIDYKEKKIKNKKILSEEEIKECVIGVDKFLCFTLDDMKNEVIKNFLDIYSEYSTESDG